MTITLAALSSCVGGHLASEVTVKGLSLDSRCIGPDIGFVAVPGESTDGRRYFAQALASQTPIIIYEAHNLEQCVSESQLTSWREAHPDTAFLPVTGLAQRMGALAEAVYPVASSAIKLAAVTGTNGKTTTSGWIAGACETQHAPAGLAGTIGIGLYGALQPAENTTPDVFTLWRWLHEVHSHRGIYAAMEASSHALAQQRFHGVPIHTAVWTHITQDHLDYHGSMAAYAAEKRKLLRWPTLKYCVLNMGDATAREAYESGDYTGEALTYAVVRPDGELASADYKVTALSCTPDGLEMTLQTPEGERPWSLPVWGRFNAENALAALLSLVSFGWTINAACDALSQVPLPAGRLEPVFQDGAASAIIDYAHTPDALKQALLSVRAHCSGRLWVVFGCGGDRDRSKRSVMGEVAQTLADCVVLTDDNPRTESSEQILADIRAGLLADKADRIAPMSACTEVPDRAQAIAFALQNASPEDVVLVAGKGHEDYQEIAGKRTPFSDRDVVKKVLATLNQ